MISGTFVVFVVLDSDGDLSGSLCLNNFSYMFGLNAGDLGALVARNPRNNIRK